MNDIEKSELIESIQHQIQTAHEGIDSARRREALEQGRIGAFRLILAQLEGEQK